MFHRLRAPSRAYVTALGMAFCITFLVFTIQTGFVLRHALCLDRAMLYDLLGGLRSFRYVILNPLMWFMNLINFFVLCPLLNFRLWRLGAAIVLVAIWSWLLCR